MNKTAIILFAALTGCSSFPGSEVTKGDREECAGEARTFARENTSTMELLAFGALGRKLKQHDVFEKCMTTKGYRTATKG